MKNYIVLDSTNCGSFFGPIAGPYCYRAELRKRLDEVFEAAQRSSNRFFVLENDGTVRAAQTTRDGAEKYMNDDRVLVTVMDYSI